MSCTSKESLGAYAFHMKMSFHSHADKTHFHMKGFARGLALKKGHNWDNSEMAYFVFFSLTECACTSSPVRELTLLLLGTVLLPYSRFVFLKTIHATPFLLIMKIMFTRNWSKWQTCIWRFVACIWVRARFLFLCRARKIPYFLISHVFNVP